MRSTAQVRILYSLRIIEIETLLLDFFFKYGAKWTSEIVRKRLPLYVFQAENNVARESDVAAKTATRMGEGRTIVNYT